MSLPRSGSSWVGESLGCAGDAAYLREPVTQSDPRFHRMGTVFELDSPEILRRYAELADRAFAGCPSFPADVIRFPEQWALRGRRSRRVLVKEVNPLACEWYADRYALRLVLLVRHPVAVALSVKRKGWLPLEDASSWADFGEFQGRALRRAHDSLGLFQASTAVRYEDLCAGPLATFRRLYEFAGLTWGEGPERFVAARTQGEDQSNTWHTSRDTRRMPGSWRGQAPAPLVSALRARFAAFDLPWYRGEDEWV
jgi:hypothetical protein